MCRGRVVLRVVGIRKERCAEFRRTILRPRRIALRREELRRAENAACALPNRNRVLSARCIQIDIACRELELLVLIRLIVKNHPDVLVRHLITQIERIRDGAGKRKALVAVGR